MKINVNKIKIMELKIVIMEINLLIKMKVKNLQMDLLLIKEINL